MKTMTCAELGGACDETFTADTFEEIAELSKAHGRRMYEIGDKAHLSAMQRMKDLMNDQHAMRSWFDEKRRLFNEMPDD